MFEPNWLGVFIVAVFPWFLFALDHGKNIRISRNQSLAGLAILLVTLLLNMSRFAWLTVALQAALWSFASFAHLRRYIKRFLFWSMPVVALLVLAWIMAPATLRDSMIQRFVDLGYIGQSRGSAAVRLVNYTQLLRFFKDHPWFGYGSGTWATLIGANQLGASPTTTYLYVLVEVGLVGATFMGLALVAYLYRLYSCYQVLRPPEKYYLWAGCLSALGVFISGWFVDVKSILSYFPMFGLYLAMSRLYYMRLASSPQGAENWRSISPARHLFSIPKLHGAGRDEAADAAQPARALPPSGS
jgi:O-antigen ligase